MVSHLCFYNPANVYLFCEQVHILCQPEFLLCHIAWNNMEPKACFSIFYISADISILVLVFPFPEGPTLFLIMSGLQMHCCSAWKMTEGQAKIINFNDISTPSLSCVIPVYAAAINLCLSKRVCARDLNVDRAEEANLLQFDKVWPHLAIQGGWVPLVNCASIFSDPNCSISFQDPLISMLSICTVVSVHSRW